MGRTDDVVVVGSGPTGMVLAAELKLAGLDPVVLERRETAALAGSRGGGFHSRTLELLDQRGVAERFVTDGSTVNTVTFGSTTLDLSGLPTRHLYTLALFQNHVERLLLEWLTELGVEVRRGVEVTGAGQDDAEVRIRLADGATVRGAYVVACDGGRSAVRRSAGIAFTGPDATRSSLIAEAHADDGVGAQGKVDARGVHGVHPMGDGTLRIVVTEVELAPPGAEPTMADLRRELTAVFGTDFGVHDPVWLSRFTDATRQAETYRKGRVLVAGDAAHVHSPTGGMGIGLGIQDAVNLGWKLARVARGRAGDALLDTYDSERRPAGARALGYTMAQSLFQRADPRQMALRDLVDAVLARPGAGDPVAALVTGLDVAYDLGPGHPQLGRRVPDLDLVTAQGPVRLHSLLHAARPVLLELGGPTLTADGHDDVDVVPARLAGDWTLPLVGEVPPPTGVLVRPDGHAAWVGEGSSAGLPEALERWFGGPGTEADPRHAPA